MFPMKNRERHEYLYKENKTYSNFQMFKSEEKDRLFIVEARISDKILKEENRQSKLSVFEQAFILNTQIQILLNSTPFQIEDFVQQEPGQQLPSKYRNSSALQILDGNCIINLAFKNPKELEA